MLIVSGAHSPIEYVCRINLIIEVGNGRRAPCTERPVSRPSALSDISISVPSTVGTDRVLKKYKPWPWGPQEILHNVLLFHKR